MGWKPRPSLDGLTKTLPCSKRCSNCGHIVEKLPLKVREWDYPSCGTNHDRDLNAAKNILAVGLGRVFKVFDPPQPPLKRGEQES
jgi:transposase